MRNIADVCRLILKKAIAHKQIDLKLTEEVLFEKIDGKALQIKKYQEILVWLILRLNIIYVQYLQ